MRKVKMIRNMSETVIITAKPFHSYIFGGTDLYSEISSYIILRSFFYRLLSNNKTYGKFKYFRRSKNHGHVAQIKKEKWI